MTNRKKKKQHDFGQFYSDDDNAGDNDSCDSNHSEYVSDCHIVTTPGINVTDEYVSVIL